MLKKLAVISIIFAFTSYSVQASWALDALEKVSTSLDRESRGQDPTPDDHWDLEFVDWVMFGSGFLVGFSE